MAACSGLNGWEGLSYETGQKRETVSRRFLLRLWIKNSQGQAAAGAVFPLRLR